MNIKEKKHDWTKNGIKAKRKSIETLCELLNVKQKLGSNSSIYNASFMNDSRMNNENLKDSIDLEKLGILQAFRDTFPSDDLNIAGVQTSLSGNNPYR